MAVSHSNSNDAVLAEMLPNIPLTASGSLNFILYRAAYVTGRLFSLFLYINASAYPAEPNFQQSRNEMKKKSLRM